VRIQNIPCPSLLLEWECCQSENSKHSMSFIIIRMGMFSLPGYLYVKEERVWTNVLDIIINAGWEGLYEKGS